MFSKCCDLLQSSPSLNFSLDLFGRSVFVDYFLLIRESSYKDNMVQSLDVMYGKVQTFICV